VTGIAENNPNTLAIIQARLGSTRLPGKVLKKILGKTVLEHIIERLSHAQRIDQIIIATSSFSENDQIADLAKQKGISCFRGDEDDVLNRFYQAALQYKGDIVVRITGDCPLVDPFVVDKIIDYHVSHGGDYTSNTIQRTFPRGIVAEVLTFDVLKRLCQMDLNPAYREHVTQYILHNPEQFKLNSFTQNEISFNTEWRWVLDTEEDFEFIQYVFSRLYNNDGSLFRVEDIFNLITREKTV
jgi:spore coat polysaccharide biosynthesis protein SpsF